MKNLIFFLLCAVLLSVPVNAVFLEDDLNASTDSAIDPAASDPAVSLEQEDPSAAPLEAPADETGVAALADDGALSGGYYFVADCALGYGLRFYVPIEWAHDAFALDSSGTPVNLSNSTCYAYCPDYPDYTFSCSRFGHFTYRATNYNTSDLNIREIKETNISFLDDTGLSLSDSEVLAVIAALIFVFGGVMLVRRR